MDKIARHLHLLSGTGEIRTGTYRGTDVLIVPVVALMEGVLRAVNAPTYELVPYSSLIVAPQGWNGRPIVRDHPAQDGRQISANDPRVLEDRSFGTVFNARVVGRKLLMEAWIDPVRAERIAPRILSRIRAGEMIEVSVGVFVTAEDKSGSFQGKPFAAVWRDIVPDHLAFLSEGDIGACSIEMGCGSPRAASAGEAPCVYCLTGDEPIDVRLAGGPGSGRHKEGFGGSRTPKVGDRVRVASPVHGQGKRGTVVTSDRDGSFHVIRTDNGEHHGSFHSSDLKVIKTAGGPGSGITGHKKTDAEHVADVEQGIREDNHGLEREDQMSLGRIPTDRLKSEIDYAKKNGESDVTVKIPSGSEFSMSLPQALAVHAHLTKGRRYASNPEGINQYTRAAGTHDAAAKAHEKAAELNDKASSHSERVAAHVASKEANGATHATEHAGISFVRMDAAKGHADRAVTRSREAKEFGQRVYAAGAAHREAMNVHRDIAQKLRVIGQQRSAESPFQENAQVLTPGQNVTVNLPGNQFHGVSGKVRKSYGSTCSVNSEGGQHIGTFPTSALRVTEMRDAGGPGSGVKGHTTPKQQTKYSAVRDIKIGDHVTMANGDKFHVENSGNIGFIPAVYARYTDNRKVDPKSFGKDNGEWLQSAHVINNHVSVKRSAGGPGSGNFGHSGRPGEQGGSGGAADGRDETEDLKYASNQLADELETHYANDLLSGSDEQLSFDSTDAEVEQFARAAVDTRSNDTFEKNLETLTEWRDVAQAQAVLFEGAKGDKDVAANRIADFLESKLPDIRENATAEHKDLSLDGITKDTPDKDVVKRVRESVDVNDPDTVQSAEDYAFRYRNLQRSVDTLRNGAKPIRGAGGPGSGITGHHTAKDKPASAAGKSTKTLLKEDAQRIKEGRAPIHKDELTRRYIAYNKKKAESVSPESRYAGGPGSGQVGHTTARDTSPAGHAAAALAHNASLAAASKTAHDASAKANSYFQGFKGRESQRVAHQKAENAHHAAGKLHEAAGNHDQAAHHFEKASEHREKARGSTQRGSYNDITSAASRAAGGPGSGVRGHTTPKEHYAHGGEFHSTDPAYAGKGKGTGGGDYHSLTGDMYRGSPDANHDTAAGRHREAAEANKAAAAAHRSGAGDAALKSQAATDATVKAARVSMFTEHTPGVKASKAAISATNTVFSLKDTGFAAHTADIAKAHDKASAAHERAYRSHSLKLTSRSAVGASMESPGAAEGVATAASADAGKGKAVGKGKAADAVDAGAVLVPKSSAKPSAKSPQASANSDVGPGHAVIVNNLMSEHHGKTGVVVTSVSGNFGTMHGSKDGKLAKKVLNVRHSDGSFANHFSHTLIRHAGGPGSGVKGHTTPHKEGINGYTGRPATDLQKAASDLATRKANAATDRAKHFDGEYHHKRAFDSHAAASVAATTAGRHKQAAKHDEMIRHHDQESRNLSSGEPTKMSLMERLRSAATQIREAGGFGSGIKGHTPAHTAGGYAATGLKDPSRPTYRPGDKDHARIKDILVKSEGNKDKAHMLARVQANAIDKPDKAGRRADAARAVGEHSIAQIFSNRHKELTGRYAAAARVAEAASVIRDAGFLQVSEDRTISLTERSAGGPGSGQRGHTTPQELAKAHDAAAAAHNAAAAIHARVQGGQDANSPSTVPGSPITQEALAASSAAHNASLATRTTKGLFISRNALHDAQVSADPKKAGWNNAHSAYNGHKNAAAAHTKAAAELRSRHASGFLRVSEDGATSLTERSAGGPGSGVRGHHTDHETAAKAHLAAADVHQRAIDAHAANDGTYANKIAAGQASYEAYRQSQKVEDTHSKPATVAARLALTRSNEMLGTQYTGKRVSKADATKDKVIAAHADAIFTHQQAAKARYKAAGLRMAGGPGSGQKGHTTPHEKAAQAHEKAAAAHNAASSLHAAIKRYPRSEGETLFDTKEGTTAANATNAAHAASLEAIRLHDTATGESDTDHPAYAHAEDAVYSEKQGETVRLHNAAAREHLAAAKQLRSRNASFLQVSEEDAVSLTERNASNPEGINQYTVHGQSATGKYFQHSSHATSAGAHAAATRAVRNTGREHKVHNPSGKVVGQYRPTYSNTWENEPLGGQPSSKYGVERVLSNPEGINQYSAGAAAHEKAAAAHQKAGKSNARMQFGHSSVKKSESAARVSSNAMTHTLLAEKATLGMSQTLSSPTVSDHIQNAASDSHRAVNSAHSGRDSVRDGGDGSLSHMVASDHHYSAATEHLAVAKELRKIGSPRKASSHGTLKSRMMSVVQMIRQAGGPGSGIRGHVSTSKFSRNEIDAVDSHVSQGFASVSVKKGAMSPEAMKSKIADHLGTSDTHFHRATKTTGSDRADQMQKGATHYGKAQKYSTILFRQSGENVSVYHPGLKHLGA